MENLIELKEGDTLTVRVVPKADVPAPSQPENVNVLGTLEGVSIYVIIQDGEMRVEWTANMAVDCDGMPVNTYNDPYWQSQTSLSYNGKPINANKVPYIVVPPMIRNGVEPVVMGCQATVLNTKNGKTTAAVVADQGPSDKIGEASCECARRVGLDGNPNHGGTDDNIIKYTIFPGVPATVDGITYNLQPS
jgi:hypothetical protein